MLYITVILVALAFSSLQNVIGDFRRVCYYSGWAIYRHPPNDLEAQDIDPNLCTHLLFAFADFRPNTTQIIAMSSVEQAMYQPFTELKRKNPKLKTMLAVGGWNMGSKPFMYVLQSTEDMQEFATNTVRFLRHFNFDGLDIDWEYPAARGSPPQDKHRFSQLLNITRTAFDAEPNRGGKDRLLLSVAVGVTQSRARESYEIHQIERYTDFINLMMYDFHGQWESTINGHPSSLYSTDKIDIDTFSKFWASHVANTSNLNIGLPFYGHTFRADNESQIGFGSSYDSAGTLAYYEICALIKSKNVTEHILPTERVPYIVDDNLWVGYDNTQSITEKVMYTKKNHFGGVMVWAVDLDDTSGACGGGSYPLMNAIKKGLLDSTGTVVG